MGKRLTRNYIFPDADLIITGKEKIAFIRRDINDFLPFGITAEQLTELESAIVAFSETTTDVEALSEQIETTQAKDAKAEELRIAIRAVMVRVGNQFGQDSADYQRFGTNALGRQKDSLLLVTARQLVRAGTPLLPELKKTGLTAGILSDVAQTADELLDLLVDQQLSRTSRDILTRERIKAGNAIHTALMKLTKTGQNIWETSNAAKYNDYVIYNVKV